MKKHIFALATIFTLGAGAYASNTSAAEYTIQKGDTVEKIASQYSMTAEELKHLNDLTSDALYIDDKLTVLSDEEQYIVQPGDTLYKISNDHDISIQELLEWNYVSNADLIFAGEKLAVTEEVGEIKKKLMSLSTQAVLSEQVTNNNSGTQQTNSSSTKAQGQTMSMSATAYTAYCNGCSGITANGTDLRSNPNQKVIAVDPKVIPLGTRVYVEGYGEAIAADTGGAIKGNKIDVFIPTKDEALNWGRRTVQVTILN